MAWKDALKKITGTEDDGAKEEEIILDPPKDPGRVEALPVGTTFTFEQTLALMKQFAAELKKPSAEEAEKLEVERLKRQKMNDARIEVGRAAEQARIMRQANCNHKQNEGRGKDWAVNGQEFSDGIWRGMCVRCQKFVIERPMTASMRLQTGG